MTRRLVARNKRRFDAAFICPFSPLPYVDQFTSNIMQLFPRLWQQVFMYAILLVLAAHLVSFVVFHFWLANTNTMYMQLLERIAYDGAMALEGKSREAAGILPEFFKKSSRTLWIEKPDGDVVAGAVEPGLSFAERQNLALARTSQNNVQFWKTGYTEAPYLVGVPVNLLEGSATLFLFLEKMPPPPPPILFGQGLIAVCLIGGALSIWVAWRNSRPLRRLRSEVLEIANGNLNARVSVGGSVEIAQVAEAVNSMAQNLSNNITGMRELVANISHEMRSPLTRMSFSVAIIEEGLNALANGQKKQPANENDGGLPVIMDAEGNPLAMKHIGRLTQEIGHMENLVGSCLLSSKLDLQQENPKMDALDLSLLCRNAASKHEGLLQAKQLLFSQEIQDDLWVNGDEDLLSLVLANLLDNALKYTAEGGVVRLCLCRSEDSVLLRLENSHDAIDPADMARLFEPFFRVMNTAGTTCGAGLGLSLVKKIVACHRGSVRVEGGETGLLFTVSLPCQQWADSDFVRWFFERHGKMLA